MKETQIDWVDEVVLQTTPRTNIFSSKVGYEDANLLVNALRTPDGMLIESRHRHDYKSYVDNKTGLTYFVDGGLTCGRGNYSEEGVEDLRIYDLDDIKLIREHFSWGNRGKCGTKPLKYVLLKDMTNEHISAILQTQTHIPHHIHNMFLDELVYRFDNIIYVED